MEFVALNKRLLVKKIENEKQTQSGIYLGTRDDRKVLFAEVKVKSDDITEDVSVGDVVMFNNLRGHEVVLDNESYLVLDISDILGTVKE